MRRATIIGGLIALLFVASTRADSISDLNFPLVRIPSNFTSHRTTKRDNPEPGKSVVLFDAKGPGCVRHFWITCRTAGAKSSQAFRLTITVDGAKIPQVDMPLGQFFGVMLGQEAYRIESAAIKVLPRNGYNCYLPIPFAKSCRITLTNVHDQVGKIWSMVNWQKYKSSESLTPYRLHAVYHEAMPAEKSGSFLMANVSGRGFVAGMVKAVREIDRSDRWFHTGGDLWLIDGETDPHALRGIGGEDVFGYSFGVHESLSQWTGTPYLFNGDKQQAGEIVAYRFFGPDPVAFDSSLVLRFGSKANDLESVVYYYHEESTTAPQVESPDEWTILGPFECKTFDDFSRVEFPEKNSAEWPASWQANFGQYESKKPLTFRPTAVHSEHTWVDFTRWLRTPKRTNVGTQPVEVSAYATTTITSDKEERIELLVGFDDWMKLWINGQPVAERRHDNGFTMSTIPVSLHPGKNRVLLKLSNFDNQQWRLWAFSFRVRRPR